MTDPDFPEGLTDFIRSCIPNVDAAELLLALASDEGRAVPIRHLLGRLEPTHIGEADARRYLGFFESCGLVRQSDDMYAFAPATPQSQEVVQALGRLYHQRPVTLVRMIYSLKDDRIRAFADAFRIKKS